jgi:hypothetical protein
LVAASGTWLFAGACAPDPSISQAALSDSASCRECQTVLADCSAKASADESFAACRDQWRGCLLSKALGPIACSNPRDAEACDLCRGRLASCRSSSTTAGCGEQFAACKKRLMVRADLAASCKETSGGASCASCQAVLASCLFDASSSAAASGCHASFDQCRLGQAGGCQKPSGAQGCTLCQGELAECADGGATSCAPGFDRCTTALATGASCTVPGGSSSAPGGSSSATAGTSCTHDPCKVGVALDPSGCACAAHVCAVDSSCCDGWEGGWGSSCVELAATVPACGPCKWPQSCAHDPCAMGDPLAPSCDACASAVCLEDDYCCTTAWDKKCVDIALASISCSCPGAGT